MLPAQRPPVEHPRYELHSPLEGHLDVDAIGQPVTDDSLQVAHHSGGAPREQHVCNTGVEDVVDCQTVLLLQCCGVAPTTVEHFDHVAVCQQFGQCALPSIG